MKTGFNHRGFTLIEMLVVIAIIAILLGLLFPALSLMLKRSKAATVRTEVKSIETAINAYVNDYGKFPYQVTAREDMEYKDDDYLNLINALRGLTEGLDPNPNPRKINYLEVAARSFNPKDQNAMCDPWDQRYNIKVDANYDRSIQVDLPENSTNIVGRSIVVWSAGEPGKEKPEIIYSW